MDGFLNPNNVLNQMVLRSDMSGADLGCGSGGWAIPLAKKLKDGIVFAVDLLAEPLSALSGKAQMEKVGNIRAIRADVEKEVREIGPQSIDLVLATNLLFQAENKKEIILEAKRILKPAGKLLIVDWQAGAPSGPKGKEVSPAEIKKITEEAGFKFEQELDAGSWHFALVLLK